MLEPEAKRWSLMSTSSQTTSFPTERVRKFPCELCRKKNVFDTSSKTHQQP